MDDMLELESQLVVAQVETQSMPSDAVSMETASHNAAGSYDSSKKSSTWKKLKKMVNQPKLKEVVYADHMSTEIIRRPSSPGAVSAAGTHTADDAESEVMSEVGASSVHSAIVRGAYSRSGRNESKGGSLKGMFELPGKKSSKKVDPLQLDALRIEMGLLQERLQNTEREYNACKHEVQVLRQERDDSAGQVQELAASLQKAQSELSASVSEGERIRQLHLQVKSALQETYVSQQELGKQMRELEELCSAQQNSLEEGEERFRGLQQEQDKLRHAALQSKAQLVTAQAQLAEGRAHREELLTELADLTTQVTTLQEDLDAKNEKVVAQQAAAEQANAGLEQALSRLQELGGEQQQLEARVGLITDENKELAQQLSAKSRQCWEVESSLGQSQSAVMYLQAQLDASEKEVASLKMRLQEMNGQLEGSNSLKSWNAELLRELAGLREQQQTRPSSPFSKLLRAQTKTPSGAAAGAGPLSAGVLALNGQQPAAALFSPMKSQLPTVAVQRQQSQQQLQQQQEQQQEVIMAQSAGGPFYGAEYDGCSGSLPAPVEASCTVIAAAADPGDPALLDMTGPLTAARPASSWRHKLVQPQHQKHALGKEEQPRWPVTGVLRASCNADSIIAAADPSVVHADLGSELGQHSCYLGRHNNSSNGGAQAALGRGELQEDPGPMFAKLFSCFRPAVERHESDGGAVSAM